jgi:hypothetical protein
MLTNFTLAELNEQARIFWAAQAALLEKRMADEAVCDMAFETINAELIRGVPARYQTTLESALLDAENKRNRHSKNFSQKGGKAKKTDALQDLIDGLVRKTPSISVKSLEKQIRTEERQGIIEEVTAHKIYFNHDGRSKSAPLSGLKHRLTRANKKLQNS